MPDLALNHSVSGARLILSPLSDANSMRGMYRIFYPFLSIVCLTLILFFYRDSLANSIHKPVSGRHDISHIHDTPIRPQNPTDIDPSNPITIITSFWLVPGSKHSKEEYQAWMQSFLSRVTANVVIFTSRVSWETMGNLKTKGNVAFVFDYEVPFDIPCMQPLEHEYRAHQWFKDPDRQHHGPELYAIWNGKGCLVNRVIRENAFKSKYFFWVDIGSFRNAGWNTTTEWPALERVEHLFASHPDTPVFAMVRQPWEKMKDWKIENGPHQPFLIQGGFFGGTIPAIHRFVDSFWTYHDMFMSAGHFIGKDENVMDALLTLKLSDSLVIPSFKLDGGACGNIWFYFQQYLALGHQRVSGCNIVEPQKMSQLLLDYYKP